MHSNRDEAKLKTRYGNVKTVESCGSHLGVSFEKESRTRCATVETKPASKYVRIRAENQKEKFCLCSLSPHDILFLFGELTRSIQFSFAVSLNDNDYL